MIFFIITFITYRVWQRQLQNLQGPLVSLVFLGFLDIFLDISGHLPTLGVRPWGPWWSMFSPWTARSPRNVLAGPGGGYRGPAPIREDASCSRCDRRLGFCQLFHPGNVRKSWDKQEDHQKTMGKSWGISPRIGQGWMMFLNMYWRSMWCAFLAQKIRTEISVQRKNQRRRFEVEVERSRDREVTVAKTY